MCFRRLFAFITLIAVFNSECQCEELEADSTKRHVEIPLNSNEICRLQQMTKGSMVYCHHESGANRSVHFYLTSFGSPSFLIFETPNSIDIWNLCNDFTVDNPECIELRSRTAGNLSVEAVGMSFTKLMIFDDPNDQANVSLASSVYGIPLNGFDWDSPKLANDTESVLFTFSRNSSKNEKLLGKYGVLEISAYVMAVAGRGVEVPRLLHSGKAVQVDIAMKTLQFENFTSPRLALELFAVSNQDPIMTEQPRIENENSIDDEFSPGIFHRYSLLFPDNIGYVSWKPVSYTDSERSRNSLTQVRVNGLQKADGISVPYPIGLLSGFFGNLSSVAVSTSFNITFGYPKDKFYSKESYSVWSLGIGLDVLPENSFSTLILVVLICCFALPALAILSGVTIAVYSRIRKRYGSNQRESLIVHEEPISGTVEHT